MNPFNSPKLYDADGDLSRQWYVYYNFKHPETGKNERFRVAVSRGLKTKMARYEKAAVIKKELKRKLLQGYNPFVFDDKRNTNCIEALEYVKIYKKATLSKRSGFTYSSVITIFQNWLESVNYQKKTIEAITRHVADRYADNMILHENISNRTINNRVSFLRTIFSFLVKKEYLDVNPFKYVDYLKIMEPGISAFTRQELKLITDKLPGYHYQLYVISQLIFYCFLRPAEIVRLQFKDVLWGHGIITIPGTKTKNGESRVIILPDSLVKNLKDWDLDFPADYYIFGGGKQLIPARKEIAPTRIAEVWRKFADLHKIKKNIYDLKLTGNGMAVDAGLNIRDIQLQNRHHSLEQTQQYLDKFRRTASDGFKSGFVGF